MVGWLVVCVLVCESIYLLSLYLMIIIMINSYYFLIIMYY